MRGGEVGALQEEVSGRLGDSSVFAAHDARDGDGLLAVGDDEVVGSESVSGFVESEEFLSLGGGSDNDASVEFGEVEGMQGLADLHEDEVGDVDDVVDGAEADAFEPLLKPGRAGTDLDAAHDAGGVKWAGGGVVDADAITGGGRRWGGCGAGVAGTLQRSVNEGREFARKTEVAEEVGPIGGDLEIEDNIAGDDLLERGAGLEGGIENPEAVGIFADADFFGTAHHAAGGDATEFPFLDGEAAGQGGTGEGQWDLVADFVVLGPADNLACGAAAVIDLADAEAVRIGVRDGLLHLGDHDEFRLDSDFIDTFHFDAREGEEVAQFGDGAGAEIEMSAEPVEGDFHGAGAEGASNLDRIDGIILD